MSTAQELANQLQAAYDSLCRTFGLLQVEEIETGQMANGWSPKALMAHIAFWDEYQTARMQAAFTNATVSAATAVNPVGANGFARPTVDNDERAAADQERSWETILAAADLARSRMIDFTHTLDEAQLAADYPEGDGTLSFTRLLEHMVRHTRLHAQELQQYCGSMQRWSRGALRALIVQQHTNLMDGISHLPEAEILTAQVCGTWTIRDLLVHVLSWNEYESAVLQQWPDAAHESLTPWLDGHGVDDINANLLAERAELTMIDVCDGLMTYHRRILRAFDRATDEQLGGLGDYGWGEEGTLSNFFYSFALHEAEHAEDLWRYRAGEG
ncbi:MAG: DinB family protein [Caldilineaceae bacterium]|nr:DinB family protein [Caldilineaceae bacterium]